MDKELRDKLLDIADDFLNVRTVITLGAFITVYVLVWQAKEVPQIISHIMDILLGFWFGEKVANASVNNGASKENEKVS